MLWAGLLTAFFGFLRSSELLALRHEDITQQGRGYSVRIKSSKTDLFWSGCYLTLLPSGDSSLCPVEALTALRQRSSVSPGPLFTFSDGATLTRARLNVLIKMLATRCGIRPDRYSSHSFRIGAASVAAAAAAAAGVPDWELQALGRWSSDCYWRYIRLPNTDTNVVAIRQQPSLGHHLC